MQRESGPPTTVRCLLFCCLSLGGALSAVAQSQSSGSLNDPVILAQLNALEQRAAIANQAVYDVLAPLCAPPAGGPPTGACTSSQVQSVFANVQQLVQTANEILGRGPISESLGLDVQGLGRALQWTAAEELLAQGSIATRFAGNQQATLSSRLAALRVVSRALRIADGRETPTGDDESVLAAASPALLLGGGASADGSGYSRLNIFFDGSSGWGTKDPTDLEDAFAFRAREYSIGVDYRLSASVVAGLIAGYSDRRVDFDSSQSVVDGNMTGKGWNALLFMQWDSEHAYVAGSLGYQRLAYAELRGIHYPSLNPAVPSVDTAVNGDTHSHAFLASLNAGLPWHARNFGAELYLKGDYLNVSVDGFTETLASGADDRQFQFQVDSQSIKSFDSAVGLKLDGTFSAKSMVFVPYARAEYHRELEPQPHVVSSFYAALPADIVSQIEAKAAFTVSSNQPGRDYQTYTFGVAAVLRGSTKVDAAGRAGGALQGYFEYTTVQRLQYYHERVWAGGLRYEF
ncbi:MAG TPA: autotransporter outer membrane beta-barrel domain-containing protein [Steroidobacteraceae bacterium]|nr:autotransporter outer membrane beta-barrel domain-containing protein [Steroidobacteraceae bacterium]